MRNSGLIPLALMNPGDSGVIEEMRGFRHHMHGMRRSVGSKKPHRRVRQSHLETCDPGHRLEHRLNCLGLLPGEKIKVIQNSAPGPILIAVKDSRLCLGRGVAFKLMVRPDGTSNRGSAE